jgi:hypothetical protein
MLEGGWAAIGSHTRPTTTTPATVSATSRARRPLAIRSDRGPVFDAKDVQDWIAAGGARTAFIPSGSLWEKSYIEHFNETSSTRSPGPASS